MTRTFTSRTLTVSIDCPPDQVYGFASNPENFPRWATSFCTSIRRADSGWILEMPQGQVTVSFVPRNTMGVMDHFVTPVPGVEIYVPIRIVANGSGSEVLFTLFHLPGMTNEEFAADVGMVERDLGTLKKVMEGSREWRSDVQDKTETGSFSIRSRSPFYFDGKMEIMIRERRL